VTFLPASRYAPDSADKNADCSANIVNVFPDTGGYIPCPMPVPVTTPLAGANTVFVHNFLDGEIALFAATADRIYRWYQYLADANDGAGWKDVSRKGLPYNCFDEQGWSLVSFNDLPIAANIGDCPQIWDRKTQRFRDLQNKYNEDGHDKDQDGKPYPAVPVPYTRQLAVGGDYLFLAGTSQNPHRLVWSGTKDPEMWQAGVAGSSFNDFTDGGEVMAVQNAVSPLVFLRRAVYQLNRTPTSSSFTVQKMLSNRGCAVKGSLADSDGSCFFMDEDGFHAMGTETGLQNIGYQAVDRAYSRLVSTRRSTTRVSTLPDAKHGRVYWVFYDTEQRTGQTLLYDYRLQRWSKLDFGGTSCAALPLQATSLDTMDKWQPDSDRATVSYDSDTWNAEEARVAFLAPDGTVQALIGINAEAVIDSGDMGDTANSMARVNNVYPNIDTRDFPCRAEFGLMMKDGALSERRWSREYSQSKIDGGFRPLLRGKQLIVRVTIPEGAEWTKARGVDVQFAAIKAGNR